MHCAKHLDALLYALHLPASSAKRTCAYSDPNNPTESDALCYRRAKPDCYRNGDFLCFAYGYAEFHAGAESNSDRHALCFAYGYAESNADFILHHRLSCGREPHF